MLEPRRKTNWRNERNAFLYKGLKQVVQAEKPEVAHVQYMAPGAIPIILLRMIGIKNVIATAHTAADIYPNLKLVHFIQRHCIRVFTNITLTAEKSFFGNSCMYTQQTKLQKRNPLRSIMHCLRTYRYVKIHATFPHLLLWGYKPIGKDKGNGPHYSAFEQIKKGYPKIHLLIVGDGSLKEQMQQQAKDSTTIKISHGLADKSKNNCRHIMI